MGSTALWWSGVLRRPLLIAFLSKQISFLKLQYRGFPGYPVAETSLSSAGGESLTPDQEARISHALPPKIKNIKKKTLRNDIVTNSIKTF